MKIDDTKALRLGNEFGFGSKVGWYQLCEQVA